MQELSNTASARITRYICLRMCYAKSGTNLAHRATRILPDLGEGQRLVVLHRQLGSTQCCATHLLCDVQH
eukprot:560412-Rhodomonas_salina.4